MVEDTPHVLGRACLELHDRRTAAQVLGSGLRRAVPLAPSCVHMDEQLAMAGEPCEQPAPDLGVLVGNELVEGQ